ncbi:MAG: hypothetical protein GYA15_13440 [Leptolinea sp.]|nr:hypothetical protein [Leptolinea sp.]
MQNHLTCHSAGRLQSEICLGIHMNASQVLISLRLHDSRYNIEQVGLLL